MGMFFKYKCPNCWESEENCRCHKNYESDNERRLEEENNKLREELRKLKEKEYNKNNKSMGFSEEN